MRTQLPTVFLAAALACSLFAAPAQAAGAPRTFVSAAGSDANNCINVATPCRHLAAAYAATAPNGEIYVLDPANYGSLTINHGVSIEGHGWASIAPVSGGNAIIINANPGDAINIIGVVLDGTALTGTSGIVFNSGGSLTVADSVIRNFGVTGIYVGPASFMHLLISNTLLSDNTTAGINLVPVSGSGVIIASIDRVTVNSNGYGIFSDNASGGLEAEITNSVISSNLNGGIAVTAFAPNGAVITIKDSAVSHHGLNGAAAISASNSGGGIEILLSHSLIAHNANGIVISGGAFVFSAGDNDMFDNNTPISGGTLQSNPKQ